jgi:hypothetical protein
MPIAIACAEAGDARTPRTASSSGRRRRMADRG